MIEFKNKYDKKFIDKACRISISQILIPLIVVAIGFFALSIYYFVADHIIIGLIWLVLSIVYIPLTYFITIITQISKYDKLYLKENKNGKFLVDTYQFDEDSVLLSTDLDEKNISKVDTDYKYFLKVIETKTDYIMYKNKSSIFILPKESITVGTLEEFQELLKTHFADRYKCKIKNKSTESNETPSETKNNEEIVSKINEPIVEEQSTIETNSETNEVVDNSETN